MFAGWSNGSGSLQNHWTVARSGSGGEYGM